MSTELAEGDLPGLTAGQRRRLEGWLADQGLGTGTLEASLLAGGRSNLTYRLTGVDVDWVLRRPPLGGRTASAHDVGREFRVAAALAPIGFPVAGPVVASEDVDIIGTPFAIQRFVQGKVVRTRDDLVGLEASGRHEAVNSLVETLAQLHSIDPAAVGLADFGSAGGYARRQLHRWSGQWRVVGAERSSRLRTAGDRIVAQLGETVPDQLATAIVHGDYRIDNVLLDPRSDRVAAVVDWELSTLGDPVADVALMCVYRSEPLNQILGFDAAWTSAVLPSVDSLASSYEASGGVVLAHWDFWMAMSAYKLAVIASGIDYRWRRGGGLGEGFDRAGEAVEPLLETALRHSRLA